MDINDEELIADFESEMASENIIQYNPEKFDRLIALARKGAAVQDLIDKPCVGGEWKMVPVEPTEAMLEASNREWDGRMSARSAGVWKVMLEAAPRTRPIERGRSPATVTGRLTP